ncbi:MAG: hypothetical protein JST92_06835 [Deltaproteobacteria bacterium]|nr:hypothetical protein [Deltaproteobacteria bacterium]
MAAALVWLGCRTVRAKLVVPMVQTMRADHARFWPEASRDLRTLDALTNFQTPTSGHDASAFLESAIGFEASSGTRPQTSGAHAFPLDLAERMRGDAWMKLDPAATKALDMSWLSALREFEFWDVWPAAFAGPKPVSVIHIPVPRYIELQRWSRARLLRGRLEGDAAAAHDDVVHLAALMFSTHTCVGTFSATLISLDLADFEGPNSNESSSQASARRALRAPCFALQTVLTREQLRQAIADFGATSYGCVAIAEAAAAALARPGLRSERAEQFALIGAELARVENNCRLTPLVRAWNQMPGYEVQDLVDDSKDFLGGLTWTRHLPIVSATLFAVLDSLATPTWSNAYRPKVTPP